MTRTTIDPNPSPKLKFHQNERRVHQHNEIIQSQQFDESIDIALLEYQRALVAITQSEPNLNSCAVNHIKICGAMEFIKVLKHLGLMPSEPPQTKGTNLIHK